MTEGDRNNSGELSSFLHLTGWRPLVLALIAGLAGAIGLFGALRAPAEFQARYVLNANRVAEDGLTPAELDIFVEEIAQTAKFPQVEAAVLARTGLVNEEDYEIVVNQSGSSVSTVDINVVAERAEDAQAVAIETGIEALTITLEKVLGGYEAGANQLSSRVAEIDSQVDALKEQTGDLNPSTAYDLATRDVLARLNFLENPPTQACTLADGTQGTCEVPEPSPSLEVLQERVSILEPLDREYRKLVAEGDALSVQLSDRNSSIRDTRGSLGLVEIERESPLIISEVVTEETSRIAGLLTGLLLFAVPAALLVILFFVILDAVRRKPEEQPLRRAEDFPAAGVLEAQGQRALPEASITPLVVVEEEAAPPPRTEVVPPDGNDTVAISNDDDDGGGDDDEPTTRRSKDGRWGRDASSKAG